MAPRIAACQASLSITNSQSLLKLMVIESVMPSNHLILCHPLLLLPAILPSIRVFHWVSSSHQMVKHWGFSFNISTSNEYSGLISFRIDWLDLPTVQGTSNTTAQKHQFFSSQPSLQSNARIRTWLCSSSKTPGKGWQGYALPLTWLDSLLLWLLLLLLFYH